MPKVTRNKSKKIYRSAKTGEYVSQEFAEANPETTVSEKVQPREKQESGAEPFTPQEGEAN